MQNFYERDVLVSSTLVDSTCHMSLFQADMLLQDAMTELFWSYECDAVRLSRDYGAVWAVARSKLIFDRMPFWMDRIRLRVFPVKVTPVSIHVDLLLEGLDGTPLIRGKQELCAVDVQGHGLRRVDTTSCRPPSRRRSGGRRSRWGRRTCAAATSCGIRTRT